MLAFPCEAIFKMIIGVPKEVKDHESRVGITPAGVKALVDGEPHRPGTKPRPAISPPSPTTSTRPQEPRSSAPPTTCGASPT